LDGFPVFEMVVLTINPLDTENVPKPIKATLAPCCHNIGCRAKEIAYIADQVNVSLILQFRAVFSLYCVGF
jgi:hypothetical protein